VEGCHVRPHRREQPVKGTGTRLELSLESGDTVEVSTDVARLNSRKARQLFAAVAKKNDVKLASKHRHSEQPLAYWQEMVGSPDRMLGIAGPVSDLLVVSRPKKNAKGKARTFMLAALFNSGKPVLVLPQKNVRPGKRICIAWNRSVESARAVAAALPLLQKAKAVHIISCGKLDVPGPSVSQLRDYLATWGVGASSEITRGRDDSREILEQYAQTKSNLLVMGAYSRGYLRERILGGVTHTMLNRPGVNLFTLHS
jgi:nucleotide-binding universal stress UspA family protein